MLADDASELAAVFTERNGNSPGKPTRTDNPDTA